MTRGGQVLPPCNNHLIIVFIVAVPGDDEC